MLEKILPFLHELHRNFRLADAADIFIISVLIYLILRWLQENVSRPILTVVAFLTILYLLSESLGLFLTSIAFQSIFTVLALALVVVFQDEVKRSLQRVSGWSFFHRTKPAQVDSSISDLLVTVAFGLSERRFGGLLVLVGRESIEPHLEGGTHLDGQASASLLYSIFDPHTPGHDGAVLFTGERVKRFSVQLPLSKNRQEMGDLGTRHSAAVGLSQVSDALIIVVSEETGSVKVAHQKQLIPMESPEELKERIDAFNRRVHPIEETSSKEQWLTGNRRLKLLALSLACLAWFLFAFHVETVERTFVVPIEYRNVPDNLRLGSNTPTEIKATLSGSEREFLLLKPGNLKFSLDLSDAKSGRRFFIIPEKSLNCPSNFSVYRIDPNEIRLEFVK